MARRSKSEVVDLAQAHELTAGLIDALTCPDGKTQAFLRDTKAPALRVRVTAGAAKSYVFERKLNRQTVRKTIGDVRDWTLAAARAEASRLGVMLDSGTDPREVERQKLADAAARKAQADAEAQEALAQALTVADVWPRYMAEGKPKRKAAWKPRYRADLLKAAAAGGEPLKRGKGLTKPGHLAALMPLSLTSIDQVVGDNYLDRSTTTILAGQHRRRAGPGGGLYREPIVIQRRFALCPARRSRTIKCTSTNNTARSSSR